MTSARVNQLEISSNQLDPNETLSVSNSNQSLDSISHTSSSSIHKLIDKCGISAEVAHEDKNIFEGQIVTDKTTTPREVAVLKGLIKMYEQTSDMVENAFLVYQKACYIGRSPGPNNIPIYHFYLYKDFPYCPVCLKFITSGDNAKHIEAKGHIFASNGNSVKIKLYSVNTST
jgi:hypothetical protein